MIVQRFFKTPEDGDIDYTLIKSSPEELSKILTAIAFVAQMCDDKESAKMMREMTVETYSKDKRLDLDDERLAMELKMGLFGMVDVAAESAAKVFNAAVSGADDDEIDAILEAMDDEQKGKLH